MQNVIIISCWFGAEFTRPSLAADLASLKALTKYLIKIITPIQLYRLLGISTVIPKAPLSSDVECIFFTNNPRLTKLIKIKGWTPQLLPSDIKGINSIDSSLRAKAVKFLRLENHHLKSLSKESIVIYMDSRRISDDVAELVKLAAGHAIVIRKTPRPKDTIWGEVEDAISQERYAASMASTIEYIDLILKEHSWAREAVRISNTGVIVYNFKTEAYAACIESLTSRVYRICQELRQPECQIIWAMEAQQYSNYILQIEHDEIETRDQ